ncbi:Oligopeptide/dipeptide ABC transporter ATP-binding protein [Kitasatospora sp. MMS16-BH015]|uniref:ABC transporter ATP-binding protein n=1 Tax=Kitasatospora sp. MMS16-BH015 TaxID=2018025 RepID=UPI000CA33293|nr:ABC transporter ATP-binding protein [Kitasatospora sp. MMS16-BH015]AUG75504.1 Oligopeptide/dipeptide ABC transporter ATP-binding protein [Kitasatospora sp. MMS16-BH015]
MNLLEIERLSVELPGAARPVLDAVSLSVAAGEVVGLVGESGSGKSVTARAALGLLPPAARTAGRVLVDGTDLLDAGRSRLRELRSGTVSMVFQDPRAGINPVRRIGDFLTEPPRLTHRVPRREAAARAVELLAAVGLPEPERQLRAFPHQLSGGMLQRVMIAGALAAEPRLLLCDEPTTALDVSTQAEILALLGGLQRERGLGLLLITHDIELAAASCDRVYVMYAGRILEHATAAELFGRPRHPYTVGLLGSTPPLTGPLDRLRPVPGTPLGLDEAAPGCAFAARCGHALPGRCDREVPELRPLGGGRAAACVRLDELAQVRP